VSKSAAKNARNQKKLCGTLEILKGDKEYG
jgi:hypothetical protein